MKENGPENIEEMLNAYLDDELSERNCTEVKRLLANDAEVAERFAQLQKCKALVGSLPMARVPEGMAFEVSEALERRALLGEDRLARQGRIGAAHLFVRKVMAAAAMIAAVAVLGAVIYTIVMPNDGAENSVFVVQQERTPAVETKAKVGEGQKIEAAAVTDAPQRQSAEIKLELATADAGAVNPFVNKAIYDNLLLESISLKREANETTYVIGGSATEIGLLIGDLSGIWSKVERVKMYVEGEDFGSRIEVDNVTAGQIMQVVRAGGADEQRFAAQDAAAMNRAAEMVPGREVLAVVDQGTTGAPAVAKPVLTSGERRGNQNAVPQEGDKLQLTITVVGL